MISLSSISLLLISICLIATLLCSTASTLKIPFLMINNSPSRILLIEFKEVQKIVLLIISFKAYWLISSLLFLSISGMSLNK